MKKEDRSRSRKESSASSNPPGEKGIRNDLVYQRLLHAIPLPWAYCRVISDSMNHPVDYLIVEVNQAFIQQMDMEGKDLTGKKVTDILPGIGNDPTDWATMYRRAAMTGEEVNFERCASPLNKWFSVTATSPEKGFLLAVIQDITEKKLSEELPGNGEDRFRSLVETSSDWIWEVDTDAVYTYASPKVRDILGYEPEEVIGKRPFDFMPRGEADRISRLFKSMSNARKPFDKIENTNLHKDGHSVVLETSGVPVFNRAGEYRGYQGIDRDVTARKKEEAKLNLIRYSIDRTREGIYWINEQGEFIDVNTYGYDRLGYSRDEMLNMTIADIDPHFPGGKWPAHWKEVRERQNFTFESEHRRKDGSLFPVEVTVNHVMFENQEYNLAFARDITERRKLEERLREAAITDDLTGLLNRRGFFTLAAQQCKLASRSEKNLSLVYLDIDGFKMINDELGHRAGDQALRDTADILRVTFRESDIIARIGGDEFAVLLTEQSQPVREDIIYEHIHDRVHAHNALAGRHYSLWLSAGIAHYDLKRPCSIGDFLSRADILMYRDKETRKLEHDTRAKLQRVDNRKFIRYPNVTGYQKVFLISEDDRVISAKIENISLGGLCLGTQEILPDSRAYRVRIDTETGEELSVQAKVIWSTRKRAGEAIAAPLYLSGLQFLSLDRSLRGFIARFSEE